MKSIFTLLLLACGCCYGQNRPFRVQFEGFDTDTISRTIFLKELKLVTPDTSMLVTSFTVGAMVSGSNGPVFVEASCPGNRFCSLADNIIHRFISGNTLFITNVKVKLKTGVIRELMPRKYVIL